MRNETDLPADKYDAEVFGSEQGEKQRSVVEPRTKITFTMRYRGVMYELFSLHGAHARTCTASPYGYQPYSTGRPVLVTVVHYNTARTVLLGVV